MNARGALKLCATIDDVPRHTFITRTKPEYQIVMDMGSANVPQDTIQEWVKAIFALTKASPVDGMMDLQRENHT